MKKSGFTLLELMIVVAIIMIMGGGAIFGLRMRADKDEYLKLKNSIPTIMETATLRAYEYGAPGSLTIGSKSIEGTGVSRATESKIYDISTSPAGITDLTINTLGTFEKSEFSIIISKDGVEKLTFKVISKPSLGVYSVEEIEN